MTKSFFFFALIVLIIDLHSMNHINEDNNSIISDNRVTTRLGLSHSTLNKTLSPIILGTYLLFYVLISRSVRIN